MDSKKKTRNTPTLEKANHQRTIKIKSGKVALYFRRGNTS